VSPRVCACACVSFFPPRDVHPARRYGVSYGGGSSFALGYLAKDVVTFGGYAATVEFMPMVSCTRPLSVSHSTAFARALGCGADLGDSRRVVLLGAV
jgi:hypothetical protein